MNQAFYEGNRQRFLDRLEEGSVTMLYSGLVPVKSNDQKMNPFSVNRNFYYLTGIDTQNVWLVMSKTARGVEQLLFIDQPDEFLIKWNGKMLTREEASERSGIARDSVLYMQDLDRTVARLLYDGRSITSKPVKACFVFDRLSMNAAPTRAEEYAGQVRNKYPAVEICNIAGVLASLRSVKAPEEVECIRRAGDVTIEALRQMLRTARPGEYEYQWVADYAHYVARAGMREAFPTIAAAGSLFLFDLGAEYAYYSSDVTRTFPVNGRFTDRQKELFCIVRDAQDAARDKMRPGVEMKEANQAVIDFYKKALRAAKLIRDDSEVSKYYYHGVSHSLGLDTHDPCDRTVYEPGMVITCEPGLYVAEEGIGIRLENDILVTENEPEDLTGSRLLDIAEIEEIMGR